MQPVTQKNNLARFGRALALLLNRSLMYQANHPFITQTVADVRSAADPLLETISPLVFILNRGQFFVDEEVLDPRLNVSRTAVLFKNSGLQSISFEQGLRESELTIFAELFAALTTKGSAEALKEQLIRRGVFNIKINHVIFKKVTEDDQVVSRDALKKVTPLLDAEDQEQRKRFMETLLESVLTEEFAKTLNITNLLANPKAFTRQLIEADLACAMQMQEASSDPTTGEDNEAGTGTPVIAAGGRGADRSQGAKAVPGLGSSVQSGDAGVSLSAAGASRAAGHTGTGRPGAGPPPVGESGATGFPSYPAEPNTATHTQINRLPGPGGGDASAEQDIQPEKHDTAGPPKGHGVLLLHQIEVMHQEVERHLQGHGEVSIGDLAQSIFEMKKQLLEAIQTQKALGIVYVNEAAIVSAADKLTDKVMVELVKEEYRSGAVSPQRLAHLIIRLIPEADDLKRLLPRIKRALLQEGMPPADYLKLIHALRNELQSEELSRVLQESAESIGLDGDMLVDEVKRDPAHAAELIYLASEIRKGGGDESALADVLVEYVERMGDQMARDADPAEGEAHLKQVLTDVESTLLKKLGSMNLNADLLGRMEERLNARMESILDSMRVQWLHSQTGAGGKDKPKLMSVLQTLEHNVGGDSEMAAILEKVRTKVDAGDIEENNFSQIHEEILRQQELRHAGQQNGAVPGNVMTSEEFMFVLEKEVARAKRYGAPFSALAFSFVSAKPSIKSVETTVTNESVLAAALQILSGTFREVDYIGQVGKNKIFVLLPMLYPEEGRKALARVLRVLHAGPLDVDGQSVELRVAGVAAGFDIEQTPDARAFAKHLAHQLTDMVARIKNIQVLF